VLVPRRPSRDSLEKLTWISREEGSATRISSDAGLAQLGIVPRRRLELPSNEAVEHALKKGYGIGAISRYVVAAELRTGSLAVIRVLGWNVRNIVSVLRVRDAKLTPSADRFQAFVRTRLCEMARQRSTPPRRDTPRLPSGLPVRGIILAEQTMGMKLAKPSNGILARRPTPSPRQGSGQGSGHREGAAPTAPGKNDLADGVG